MYPTLYSDDINNTITIKDDLSYKVAKLLWNAIAARYEPKSTPVQLEVVSDARGNTLQIKKDPVQVKPDGIKKAGGKKPVRYYKEKYKIPFDSVKEKNQYDFAVKLCKKFDKPYDEAIKLNDGKKKRTFHNNKWQIPFSPVTDRGKYDGAYALCRKYKLPYPEAIKRQEEEKNGVILQGTAEKDDFVIKIEGAEGLEDAQSSAKTQSCAELHTYEVATSPPQSETNTRSNDSLTQPLKIVTGIHVKQIKPDNGRSFYGIGTVVARENGGQIISVRNGGGKIHKIDVNCLEVVSSPEKKAAEVKA